jgi:DNA primase
VLPLIDDLPNPVERDTYRQRLARFLKLDERTLADGEAGRQKASRPARRRVVDEQQKKAPVAEITPREVSTPARKIEAHLLGQLLRSPDLLCHLDRALQENSLGRMAPEDFGVTDHQVLFRLVRESLEQDASEPEKYLVDHLPGMLAGLMGSLLEEAARVSRQDQILEDIFRTALAIRRRIVDDNLGELRFLMQEGQLLVEPYHHLVMQYSHTRQLLDQARLVRNGQSGQRERK